MLLINKAIYYLNNCALNLRTEFEILLFNSIESISTIFCRKTACFYVKQ